MTRRKARVVDASERAASATTAIMAAMDDLEAAVRHIRGLLERADA